MSTRRLRAAAVAAGATLAAAAALTSSAATASTPATLATVASTPATLSLVGDFRGAIRTGPLADLSLVGLLSVTVDNSTHKISGLLVDESGPKHLTVLAHVSGHTSPAGATLVFRTTSGRVISGTSAKALSTTAVLSGSLTITGGKGDWEEVPVGNDIEVTPSPTACLINVPNCMLTPPPNPPGHGGGKGSPNPNPGGGISGGNNDTYCAEQRAALGDQANTAEGMALLESIGCAGS